MQLLDQVEDLPIYVPNKKVLKKKTKVIFKIFKFNNFTFYIPLDFSNSTKQAICIGKHSG